MGFIQGEKFENLANGDDILYCHTHDLQNFLKANETHSPYVLITHNSDICINEYTPSNVLKWYAQNVNIVDSKIESIPIGLENNKWFPNIDKKGKMLAKLHDKKRIDNLVYCNFNTATNPIKRLPAYNYFKKQNSNWVTFNKDGCINGKWFDSYLENVYNHLFVVCPEGNGIDTHRTWECLYMNTIPIEKRNINNQYYTDLPICFVDDWSEVTREFLEHEYIRIRTRNWNFEKLSFDYWKNKILKSL